MPFEEAAAVRNSVDGGGALGLSQLVHESGYGNVSRPLPNFSNDQRQSKNKHKIELDENASEDMNLRFPNIES